MDERETSDTEAVKLVQSSTLPVNFDHDGFVAVVASSYKFCSLKDSWPYWFLETEG